MAAWIDVAPGANAPFLSNQAPSGFEAPGVGAPLLSNQRSNQNNPGDFGAPMRGTAPHGSVQTEGAEEGMMGGLRVRKVNAGVEILWMAWGDPRSSGGAALVQEGFEVGDVITAVDGIDTARMSPDEVLSSIAFQKGGIGEVKIEGFRRIAAFPRPSRVPLSGIVPRQPFRPVGEDAAVYDSSSVRKTDALIGEQHMEDDTEVSRLLLEVEDRADEIRRSRGLPSVSSTGSQPGAGPFRATLSGAAPRSSSTASAVSPPTSAPLRSPPASLFAAARRGDLPAPRSVEVGAPGSGGAGTGSGPRDGAFSATMLQQIRSAERYLRSDDVEVDGYVLPKPAGLGRETEEALEGLRTLMTETAVIKGGYMQGQQELRDMRDKLSRMNWALDGMGKMNLELQRRAAKVSTYKWLGLVALMNMDLEEDRRRQTAMEMAEYKRSLMEGAKSKQEEMARLASTYKRGGAEEMEDMKGDMEEEIKRLQADLQEQAGKHQAELKTLQDQHKVDTIRLEKRLAQEKEEKLREAEVAKIQLTHQRDVFHNKLLEKQARELNEKEVVAGLSSVNENQQTTIKELQNIIQGMRELEKNNGKMIEEQKAEILALQERLSVSTDQLVATETREYAQKQHFKAVGKENHATILSLTEDLKFMIKRREEDLVDMKQVHAAEKATLQRYNDNLKQQLTTIRNDIFGQVLRMARRLAAARLLVGSLKDREAGHVWDTQGGRYPGVHKADHKVKIHGGGKVADVSREELEELKTDLEEQSGIASALQALLEEEKKLQEELAVAQKVAGDKGTEATDYKMKYQGEFAKTAAAHATKKADALRSELVVIDDQQPPASALSIPPTAQSLPPYSAQSLPPTLTNPAVFSPSFSPQNSLPATMPPSAHPGSGMPV